MYSIDVVSKNYEAKIRDLQKNEQSLKKQVEQLNLEIKSQKRILELELGENVVSASQVWYKKYWRNTVTHKIDFTALSLHIDQPAAWE